MNLILILLGFIGLIGGAELMVRGAASVAIRAGISELAVGLTIVAMGTSAPELMVSMLSALKGATDIGIGNVIGSNISNILLILGITAIITPLAMQKSIAWREIPFTVLGTIVLAAMANDQLIGSNCPSALDRG